MESSPSLPAIDIVTRFNDALNAQDLETMMQLMTADCVFENTYPPPDGTRYTGQAAVRAFWAQFFRDADQPHIEMEEIFAAGNRCIMRWTYHWRNPAGQAEHIRGVDLYTLESGRIAAKLSYVKG